MFRRSMLTVCESLPPLIRTSDRLPALPLLLRGRRCPVQSRFRLLPAGGEQRRGRSSGDTRMPKKTVKGQPAGGGASQPEVSGPVTLDRRGGVSVAVRVKPGSKRSSITEVSAEAVGVAVAAPPVDGEANAELIRFLAEVLELKKSSITVEKGSRSRDKVVGVASSLSPEDVLQRLRQAAA